MNAEIKIWLKESLRGRVHVHFFFPDETEEGIVFLKWKNVWHHDGGISSRAEAWLKSANKIALLESEIRRLRRHGELSFPAPTRGNFLAWWKDCHTAKNGMSQRADSPNLKNI